LRNRGITGWKENNSKSFTVRLQDNFYPISKSVLRRSFLLLGYDQPSLRKQKNTKNAGEKVEKWNMLIFQCYSATKKGNDFLEKVEKGNYSPFGLFGML
jgi:hypothetical protein